MHKASFKSHTLPYIVVLDCSFSNGKDDFAEVKRFSRRFITGKNKNTCYNANNDQNCTKS